MNYSLMTGMQLRLNFGGLSNLVPRAFSLAWGRAALGTRLRTKQFSCENQLKPLNQLRERPENQAANQSVFKIENTKSVQAQENVEPVACAGKQETGKARVKHVTGTRVWLGEGRKPV